MRPRASTPRGCSMIRRVIVPPRLLFGSRSTRRPSHLQEEACMSEPRDRGRRIGDVGPAPRLVGSLVGGNVAPPGGDLPRLRGGDPAEASGGDGGDAAREGGQGGERDLHRSSTARTYAASAAISSSARYSWPGIDVPGTPCRTIS